MPRFFAHRLIAIIKITGRKPQPHTSRVVTARLTEKEHRHARVDAAVLPARQCEIINTTPYRQLCEIVNYVRLT